MFLRHQDDERGDYIVIFPMPRYKSSGLSGDEWRVSAKVHFGYKGHIIYERSFGKMEWAVNALPYLLMTFREEPGTSTTKPEYHPCDQVGCKEPASVFYRMKATYDDLGHRSEILTLDKEGYLRGFCSRHSTRGDCGLDDADENYELVGSADDIQPPPAGDIKHSAFGGFINLPPKERA